MLWVVGLACAVLIALALLISRKPNKRDSTGWPVFAKRVLSDNEQVLFGRLARAVPGHTVLAQVALSQMVDVKKGAKNYTAIKNRFYRLVADFVICKPDFSVVAVIELDDRRHDHPRRQDADRRKTEVLEAAGIPVIRVNAAALPAEQELARMLTPGAAGPHDKRLPHRTRTA